MRDANPARQLVLVFLGVILFGTVLLALPAASSTGHSIGLVDALFTSTSATCVTGLIVRDTPRDFTPFGIAVILALIQIGGLGIMTFGLLFARLLGAEKKLGLQNQRLLQEDTGASDLGTIGELLRQIAAWVLFVEVLGAILLIPVFLEGTPGPLGPVGDAFFFSVSAFCNAGFALRSDSMVTWADSAYPNLVIMGLIVLGGLGFSVLREVYLVAAARLRRSLHQDFHARDLHFSVHAKVVFVTTAILLVGGTLLFMVAEQEHTLTGVDTAGQWIRSAFLAVTARTAGFNTVDMGSMAPAGLWFMILLMAIGASPGGTGGGIKTTTVAVLYAAMVREARGEKQALLFERAVPEGQIGRALSLTFAFLILWGTAGFVLMLAEPFSFEEILFEVVSALGTVGLSMGITDKLSTSGKLLIALLMFVGRLGPITLVLGLQVSRRKGTVRFAESKRLMIG